MILTSDEVMSENQCHIASRVTKTVIHANPYIMLFLTRYFVSWTKKSAKKSSIANFAIVTKDGLFGILTSPRLIYYVTRTQWNGIVTSDSLIVLARANWRKADFHLRDYDRLWRGLLSQCTRPRAKQEVQSEG